MPIEKDREEASDDDGQQPKNDPRMEAIRLEVRRLAEMLNVISSDDGGQLDEIETSSPVSFEEGRAAEADRMYNERRLRDRFLPSNLFAEPAWDMLLDLYRAHYRKSDVSICSLCLASCVPTTTAHRWIDTMEDTKLFKRTAIRQTADALS